MLENPTQQTFQLLMSHGKLKSTAKMELEKLIFFFGDSISLDDQFMFAGDEQWIHKVEGEEIFLPLTTWSYSLAYL